MTFTNRSTIARRTDVHDMWRCLISMERVEKEGMSQLIRGTRKEFAQKSRVGEFTPEKEEKGVVTSCLRRG